MSDLISREDAVNEIHKYFVEEIDKTPTDIDEDGDEVYTDMPTVNSILTCNKELSKRIKALPSAEAEDRHYIKIYADDEPSVKAEKLYQICGETQNREVAEWLKEYFPSTDDNWIPVSERLPEDIRPVLVTWKNNDPKSYYQYIVGKHFIGTAHYYRGKWYWYSSVTEDLLAEYGKCDTEEFDEAIEAVAWMPLPTPYREENEE